MSRADLFKIAAVITALALAFVLVIRIDTAQDREETAIVREAIINAARTCYAVEGGYPDELSYLRNYYRLVYDEDRYLVTYEYIGANIIPDIFVTEVGAQ